MKKKLIELSPLIVVALVVICLFIIAICNVKDEPEEVLLSSSTLTETVKTANLATAKYIQNGICKAYVPDVYDGYVMYYATVSLTVDFSKIVFVIDDVNKTVTPIIPQFSFEVDVDKDPTHLHYYPDDDDVSAKQILSFCEKDAKDKAQQNTELIRIARENLTSSIEALVLPLLEAKGYIFLPE